MGAISELKLVADKKPRNMPVVVVRRNKLAAKLWEQIQLAKSQIEGTPFVIHKFRSIRDPESGVKKQVEVPKRIKPWWFQSEAGKVCIAIRYGSYTLELAKGMSSIEVASAADLIKTLEVIKIAVDAGELDTQIELASQHLRQNFG
ncbi:DUF6641 family protein [Polynucleobacter acidiphobus]|uniref:DUF6641 family protein n=1 Tax=Polynucleobacter acidiphobus TaxID=556053 RepID=UPI000D3A8AFB|nr:DUF6641 family protein [Polynucleobacter acidiphobus]